MKLLFHALIKYLLGLLSVALLVFFSAGTPRYANGYLFLSLLFLPMLVLGIILFIRAPRLLQRRLNGREAERTQRGVLAASALMFPLGFIVSALDFRFGWSKVPAWLVCLASALFLVGYGIYAEVMRENAYLSRTVRVEEGQRVISSGLYSVVRHPMYLATLLMFLPIPLILGSFWGMLAFLLYPILLVLRIQNEERVLRERLPGYREYAARVRFRLLPFLW